MTQEKYFNEVHDCYDVRYFKSEKTNTDKSIILKNTLMAFTQLMDMYSIKVIIAHGTLMGWVFNKKILPWDKDVDVCVFYKDLVEMNKIVYDNNSYILDINPNFKYNITKNKHYMDNDEENKIDARFICKNTGMYIDITALRYKNTLLFTKCPHVYKLNDICPLKRDTFEDCNIYIPNKYLHLLTREYGNQFIKQKTNNIPYNGYIYNNDNWHTIHSNDSL